MEDQTIPPRFQMDVVNLCLWRSDSLGIFRRVRLAPKTFDVLRYLVEHSGRLITHDEMLRVLWRGLHVQPEVLKSHILAVRTALGEKADGSHFIQTERGRGYRFIGSIPIAHESTDALPSRADTGPFVGRADELRTLHAGLQQAISGLPQTIFMSGEPGIGKTALIQHFLVQSANIPGVAVANGQCIENFAGAEPYTPVLEAFGSLCKGSTGAALVDALITIAPSWAAQMPAQLPAGQRAAFLAQGAAAARGSMVREAGALIDRLAADRPLIMVLEDLHWADYATIDLLSALCRRGSAAKFMLIATYRPEDLRTARHPLNQITSTLAVRSLCREIVLEALSGPDIGDILTGGMQSGGLAGEPMLGDVARRIQEHCGGNPLFVRITLDHLAARGLIGRVARGWRLLIPPDQFTVDTAPSLIRLVRSRIEGLTAEQRCALEAASAAGVRFDSASTARAAGLDEQSFEAVCEDLARRDAFIRCDEWLVLPDHSPVHSYAFSHSILRQALYDQIGDARRPLLHRAIGERLEELYPPGQRGALAMPLAAHFTAARDWLRALAYLRSALHTAISRLARRDALAILDQAAGVAGNLAEPARTRAELEFMERRAQLLAAGHDREAEDAYRAVAARAAAVCDTDTQIRALLGLSYVLSWHDLERSLLCLEEVLGLSGSLVDPLERDAVRVTAYSRRIWGSGWNRDDARACEEAFLRLRNGGGPLAVARAQSNFSMICILSSRYRESHDLISSGYRQQQEASDCHDQTDLARGAWMYHVGVPWSLLSMGEFGAAHDAFAASIAAYTQSGDESAVQSLTIYRGVLHFHALAYEDVISACAPVAQDVAERRGGDRAVMAKVLPLEQRISLIFCGLAKDAVGHPTAALGYFRVAEEEMARRPVHLDWYWRLALEWGLVNAHTALGDIRAARSHAERLCALAAQTDERAWQALAWEGRARVALSEGDHANAVSAVLQALASCQGVHLPIAEWRVHATAAAAYGAAGDCRMAAAHAKLSATHQNSLFATLPKETPVRAKQKSQVFSEANVFQ